MYNIMIINTSTGKLIIENGKLAASFFSRLKGLLGKKQLPAGAGLVLYPCKMIHTIGMKMPIDVLFVSKNNTIVYMVEKMLPNRMSTQINQADYVVELSAGQIALTKTVVGHKIAIINGQMSE